MNNAGMQHRAPLEDFPAERWEQLLKTNVSSVFYVGRAVGRHMIARGAGKIIKNGSGTIEARKAMGQLVCNNLAAHFSGQPLPMAIA